MAGYVTPVLKMCRIPAWGRYDYRSGQPMCRAASKLQEGNADGILRSLSGGWCEISRICGTRWKKLQLNDAALYFEPETSVALGFGFRWFPGASPSGYYPGTPGTRVQSGSWGQCAGVVCRVHKTNGDIVIELTNPSNLPDPSEIAYMEEPIVSAEIAVTTEFVGATATLCQSAAAFTWEWSILRRAVRC